MSPRRPFPAGRRQSSQDRLHGGPDGVILELVNEQLDPGMVPRAEAALAGARARAQATKGYLDGVQEIDRDRAT